MEEYIVEIEGDGKNQDLAKWAQFADASWRNEEMLKRLDAEFETWLNPWPMKRPFTRIAAVLFGIVGVLHLLRLLYWFSVIVAGIEIPLWVNWIALLISGLLSVMLWRESGN
jgi:hypothetical protein